MPNPTGAGAPVDLPPVVDLTPKGQPAAQGPTDERPPDGPLAITPELRQKEKDLLARIRRKTQDAQAFYQRSNGTITGFTWKSKEHFGAPNTGGVVHMTPRGTYELPARDSFTGASFNEAGAYLNDSDRAKAEAMQAEWDLIQLYLDEGRNDDATIRIKMLAQRGIGEAQWILVGLEFAQADAAYAEFQKTGDKHKEKAALAKLWELHRKNYQPATDALISLDKL
jgi:hypothetical protein